MIQSMAGSARFGAGLFVLVVAASLSAPEGTAGQGAPERFEGIYVGVEAGASNLVGGSLIGGVDVLAQDRRGTVDALVGARVQFFGARLVAGVELRRGWTDGALTQNDAPSLSDVAYENDAQTAFGVTLGFVPDPGRRLAVLLYASEVSRDFDVSIVDPQNRYTQRDNQGMLRYGAAAELALFSGLSARLSVGRTRSDFGDRATNMELDAVTEAAFGFSYRLIG